MDSTQVVNQVNATVGLDIGNNLTGLLEKLANQIGLTVDKIFPYYVKQAKLCGYSAIIIPLAILTLFIVTEICLRTYNKKEKTIAIKEERYYPTTTWESVEIANIIIGTIVLISMFILILYAVGHIYNPEYHAINKLIKAVGHLR